MDNKKQILGAIGIAKKAGAIKIGTELVLGEVRNGMKISVFFSSGASQNTVKRIKNCCEYYSAECYEIPADTIELSTAVGKSGPVSCIGITNINFRRLILGKLSAEENK